jgi:hypothetical protein
MKKTILFFAIFAMACLLNVNAQNLLYSNDFEQGVGDATIVGNGVIEDDTIAGFGKVFHNAAGGQAVRTNYLLLPNNVFANLQTAASNAVTISFWVNKGTAVDYFYSPIFMAYGAAPAEGGNTWPMLALQSRGLTQINCAGWSDFTDAQNVAGTNAASTVWLDDAQWHFYTAVITPTNVKVYVDAAVVNEWNLSNEGDGNVAAGIFTNGADLTYICLGGNQAWNWNDPDPAYLFDKVKIYSDALTGEQISALYQNPAKVSAGKTDNLNVVFDKSSKTICVKGAGNIAAELFNINGQSIAVSATGTFETSDLSAGVYIVKVLNAVKKVLVY